VLRCLYHEHSLYSDDSGQAIVLFGDRSNALSDFQAVQAPPWYIFDVKMWYVGRQHLAVIEPLDSMANRARLCTFARVLAPTNAPVHPGRLSQHCQIFRLLASSAWLNPRDSPDFVGSIWFWSD
jgi:hypothetical protein